MPDTFNDLRPRIVDYLYDRGIDPQKRFRCLNPKHLDRDPSMGYDAKRQRYTALPAARTMISSICWQSTKTSPCRTTLWRLRASATGTATRERRAPLTA